MQIQQDISLLPYNTFQVDVKTKFFVELKTENDIKNLISDNVWARYPHLILGGGANILFTKDYEGLVIKVSLLGKDVVDETDEDVYVRAGAGEDRHDFIMRTLEQGYVGGENLVYIPGSVGAAPIGNIGAYGKEAKDIIHQVEGIDLETGAKKVINNIKCQFGYRDSIFKHEFAGKFLVTTVTFHLQKETANYKPNIDYHDIQAKMAKQGVEQVSGLELAQMIIDIRKNKLPDRHDVGTAGSFFKNPIISKEQYETLLCKHTDLKGNEIPGKGFKLSAGQLIEFAGFKGKSQGGVGTHDTHALIIVNHGGASGEEIRSFAQSIQKKVLELFGVTLEPEVIVL